VPRPTLLRTSRRDVGHPRRPRVQARLVAAIAPWLLALTWTPSAGAAAPAHPFGAHTAPYAAATLHPTVAPKQLDAATAAAYDAWAAAYLEPGCAPGQLRARSTPDTQAHVISAGQGYAMVITALMAGHDPQAQTRFDALLRYRLAHPSRNDPRLMAWAQNATCANIRGDYSATDGDLDAAFALLLAHAQWGSGGTVNYAREARRVLKGIIAKEVSKRTRLIGLGDWTRSAAPALQAGSRPSDWMLDHFTAFARLKGGRFWKQIRTSQLSRIARLQLRYAPNTGLLPNFVSNARPAVGSFLEGPQDGAFGWSACRTPLRIGTDAALTGGRTSRRAARRMSTWLQRRTGGRPEQIVAGYSLSGQPLTDKASMAFTAPFAVAAMSDPHGQRWLDALWGAIAAAPSGGFYADSLRLQSMLVVSGNWWLP
jgi:endo-1,4-beta-D-glucanase Y